jgi:anti-sigma factor RsiW
MSEDVHKRAQTLITASRVEGISNSDRAWLNAHLADCAACALRAHSLETAVALLRSIPVTLDPEVVGATRRRVRLRARELREHKSRMRGLWMACAFSWLLGVLSAPLVWWAFQRLSQRFDLPEPLWITALAFYWVVPAAAGAAALAWQWPNGAQEDKLANPYR